MLGARLDYRARDESRLLALLELDDEQLIEAIAGRRAGELRAHWERFATTDAPSLGSGVDADSAAPVPNDGRAGLHGSGAWIDARAACGVAGTACDAAGLGSGGAAPARSQARLDSICRHRPGWPSMLAESEGAPRALHVLGGVARLRLLVERPAVAIAGSPSATDYGVEMARGLGRGLAASGVTVVSGFVAGIGVAAQAGALEANGASIAAMSGGVDVCLPASRRSLHERVRRHGCAVAELPLGFRARRWCRAARARTVAGLAQLTVIVEADEGPGELTEACVAQALGRAVVAVPGRVTSPLSRGTCGLLREGTPAVRGAADVLDLLFGSDGARTHAPAQPALAGLERPLRELLEQVGAGRDTLGKLTRNGRNPSETMHALSELELQGLLARGDGGRYLLRESLAADHRR